MKARIFIAVLFAVLVGTGVSLWNVAKAAPEKPPSFLKVGQKYTFTIAGVRSVDLWVLEIRSDAWIKIKDKDNDVWWLNTNQILQIDDAK